MLLGFINFFPLRWFIFILYIYVFRARRSIINHQYCYLYHHFSHRQQRRICKGRQYKFLWVPKWHQSPYRHFDSTRSCRVTLLILSVTHEPECLQAYRIKCSDSALYTPNQTHGRGNSWIISTVLISPGDRLRIPHCFVLCHKMNHRSALWSLQDWRRSTASFTLQSPFDFPVSVLQLRIFFR